MKNYFKKKKRKNVRMNEWMGGQIDSQRRIEKKEKLLNYLKRKRKTENQTLTIES